MRRLMRLSGWAGLGVMAAACTRVVDPGIEEGPERLVVEARVERGGRYVSGGAVVRLSTTRAIGDTTPTPVTDADVLLTMPTGEQLGVLPSNIPGTYAVIRRPEFGVYRLEIRWRGERYAATDTLRPVPLIDSLYTVFEPGGPFSGDPGLRAAITYRDPPGERNNYFWELLVNDTLRVRTDPGNRFRLISEDRFYDGGTVTGYQPFDEEVVRPGDRILVRQYSIGGSTYRYLFALFEQQARGGGGSPFSSPPATIRGNIANLTTPSNVALGYFWASDVAERAIVVPRP